MKSRDFATYASNIRLSRTVENSVGKRRGKMQESVRGQKTTMEPKTVDQKSCSGKSESSGQLKSGQSRIQYVSFLCWGV